MSNRTEWASATFMRPELVQPGEYHDDSGNTNDSLAVAFDTGSSTVVIEGTAGELRAAAERLMAAVAAA